MADGRLRAVRDDRLVGRDAVLAEDGLDRGLQALRRQRLAVHLQDAPVRRGGTQELARCVHGGFARRLRAPDPGELVLGLDPAPRLEEFAVGADLDPALAQAVRDLEREGRRRHRGRDTELLAGEQRHLAVDLLEDQAPERHLVGAELLEGTHLEARDAEIARTGDLERIEDRDPRAVPLEVEERVRNGQRHLVTDLRVPDRVAGDDQVRHGGDANGAARAPPEEQPRGRFEGTGEAERTLHRLPGWRKRSSARKS